MSILGNSPAIHTFVSWCIILAPSALLAIALRLYRGKLVVGPERLDPRQPTWPAAVALGVAFLVWLGVQVIYVSWKAHPAGHGASSGQAVQLAGADWAFLSTVPAVIGFATLLLMDFAAGGVELPRQLGINAGKLPAGIIKGLLASIVIIPPIFVVLLITEWVYRLFHIVHPMEHDLLKAMGENHDWIIRVVLIAGAVITAPLFEEFLFRGHLQTLIKRALIALTEPRTPRYLPPGPGFPVLQAQEPPLAAAPLPVLAVSHPRVWQTWVAIIVTSCLFAMVHPMWTWPSIFVLALGLGYAYERTGNLWTNIVVHCAFNSVSTYMYFWQHGV